MNRGTENVWALPALAGTVLCALFIMVYFVPFTDFVLSSGNTLYAYPGKDLLMDYALGAAWAVVLFLGMLVWPGLAEARKPLLLIWLMKCTVSLGLSLVFERRYGLDGDGYFTNAIDLAFVFDRLHLGVGTENIRMLTWLHLHLVPDSYHAAKIGFSMLGLVALYQFYRTAEIVLERKDTRLLLFLGLYPSILFWSSMLGKETPMLLGVSLFVRGAATWTLKRRPRAIWGMVAGCLIAAAIRPWYLPMMLASFTATSFLGGRKSAGRWLTAILALAAFVFVFREFTDWWGIGGMQDLIESRSHATDSFLGGGSTVQVAQVNGLGDWLKQAPAAIFMALFRPMPFEIPNVFGFVQGIENLFLLYLFARAVWRTRLRELSEPLVLGAIVFVLSWAFSYGLVSYNLGSLARYRLQILPVFLGLLLYLGRVRPVPASVRK